jgi:hypothetical protein
MRHVRDAIMEQNQPLLRPALLFRFAVPCWYRRSIWNATSPTSGSPATRATSARTAAGVASQPGLQLPSRFRIPCFGELEGKGLFADLRAAWNKSGISFMVRVTGKKQPPWCRASRIEDSDGLQVWIDTRDTRNIHRANRYCHRFVFLPAGAGNDGKTPVAQWLSIPRAREEPAAVPLDRLQVRSEQRGDGYLLESHVPAGALTGFDPQEYPRLGFTYAVVDRELGWQTFSVGPEFPFVSDPTLWGSLELVRAKSPE